MMQPRRSPDLLLTLNASWVYELMGRQLRHGAVLMELS
jgi:hypothetical protein